ncbi:HD domain-containing protein [Streptomyces sp. SRF1]|uniref:HD domain-containing protein n=1 Tax=Streptomyces sp. SRF1 TaxID=1549642 RepID=UPI0025B20F2E|nr:HD domain-containing protein [Streptomyces sp. SRF1]MDN3058287.1 HD domain-containing protein [Streptomyces sp. SRF1]
MSDKSNEAKNVTRRTILHRGAGVAAIGAASALATAMSTPPAAAASKTTADTASGSSADALPAVVAGVRIPDTEVARKATAFARNASTETLFNHVLRTYLFGCLVFDRRGVRYDRELVFVSAVLHDLGLVKAYQTPTERFEVDGADAAQRFLKEQRMSADRVAVVWDAIALHTNVGIATRKRPEIAMISVGSGMDFSGNDLRQIPSDILDEVLTAFPRKGFKQEAVDNILSLCRTKPMAELMHPFAEVGRRHIPDFPVPTVEDLLLAAPFAD